MLATRADDHGRLLAAFRKSAHALLTGPVPDEPASGLRHTSVNDGQLGVTVLGYRDQLVEIEAVAAVTSAS